MELHQLEYVCSVARCQNFTRAAEEINVSQSTLSQQINKLENELGVRLFDRTTRKVGLTPAGADFVKHANSVFHEISEAKRAVQEYLSIERGHIVLGMFPAIGYFQLTGLIADFQRAFPGVKLSFQEAECQELISMIGESKIDLALLSEIQCSNIEFYNLCMDEAVVLVSKSHPLAAQQCVSAAELSNENFIIASPSSGLYKSFAEACNKNGFSPKVVYHCNQIETNVGLVMENIGIGVLSYQVAQHYRNKVAILRMLPPVIRKISLAAQKKTSASLTVNVFIKFAMKWASEYKKNNTVEL